jgi:fatty acid desaturase
LDLPPSRSAALWLNDLSDAELQQTAADWGYVQVGRPLPEGISLTALAETLPDKVFALDLSKALGYLGLSLGVMALGYSYLWFWHSICPLWQQMLAWTVIGTGYYGVFQTAVDCAHFAFWPERPWIQDVLGAVLMAPALISYELFRLKYFNHLM